MNMAGNASFWYPLSFLNLTGPLYGINKATITYILIASGIIWISAFILRQYLKDKKSLVRYALLESAGSFYKMIEDSLGKVSKENFIFFLSLFIVIMIYNMAVLIPFVEEPTKDLNVTLACALYAVLFTHLTAYKADHKAYVHHWIKAPFSLKPFFSMPLLKHIEIVFRVACNFILSLFLFPFELLGRLSAVISLAFRLYGNIFGGATISHLLKAFLEISWVYQLIGIVSGINILVMAFFGGLEGIIQAFVFTLVTVNNLAMLLPENQGENI